MPEEPWYEETYAISVSVGGFFALLSVVISSHHLYMHLRNYTQPNLQRRITRIIWMVPIYAIDSFLSLAHHKGSLYYDTIRDAYEAYVIYAFLSLMVEYLGGYNQLRELLCNKPAIDHPWPLCKLKPVTVADGRFLRYMQQGVLQFVLIKPAMAILAIILEWNEVYDEGSFKFTKGYLYVALINNVAVSVALYCLVLFYMVTKDDLAPYSPMPKFLCIKTVVFFSFWQGVALTILGTIGWIEPIGDWSKNDVSIFIQDFLICIEMFVAAIAHSYAFSYKAFVSADLDAPHAPLLANVKDMLNIKDVMDDTYSTFMPQRGSRDVPVDFTIGTVS